MEPKKIIVTLLVVLIIGLVVSLVFLSGGITIWGNMFGMKGTDEIHVYTRSDACGAAETWAEYLGNHHQEDLQGVGVYGDPGLAEAVRKDPLGIGYNNLNYAYDVKTGEPVAGIRVIPIDLNGNGIIGEDEDFYENKFELMHAIVIGVYPSPPARDLYLVTKGKPTGLTKDFIVWCMTDGQKYVTETGYIPLPEKIEEELKKIKTEETNASIDELHGVLKISGAWALYPMVVRWSEEFQKIHPDVRIDLSAGGAGKGMADVLSGMVDIGMVSREIYPSEIEGGAFWVAVTKDCVVPTMNVNNPVLGDLLSRGVKRETFEAIWITKNITAWRDIVGTNETDEIPGV